MDFFDLREPVSAWSHCGGMLLAVPGTWYLWHRSRGARFAKRLSLLVFGLSLVSCYAASMLFHGVRTSRAGLAGFDRLDRIGIFLLIAGTYTPLAWTLLRGRWRWATLTSVWLITGVASGLLASGGPLAPAWMTGLYLAMGWGVVACYAELARVVSHRALLPLVAGGLSYSLGAVLNVVGWPVFWPGVFGAHELFHLFVIVGSLCHYYLVLKVAVPFESGGDREPRSPSRTAPSRTTRTTRSSQARNRVA